MNTPDRLPPHDPESERAALGCAIEDPSLAADLQLDWFYTASHRDAARVLMGMAGAAIHVDPATASREMKGAGIADSPALVAACIQAAYSPANFPYWRQRLDEFVTLRRIISTAHKAAAAAYTVAADHNGNVGACLDDFEREVLSIRREDGARAEADIRATLRELTDDYERAAREGKPCGLATGFPDLDRLLGGLKPQQLVILAARPSVGKTALVLGIAERLAVGASVPVGFFSLEMSSKELLHWLSCSLARVDGSILNEGRAAEAAVKRMTNAHAQLAKAPLHICDAGGLTVAQLTARARRMVQAHKIQLLIVDYLGLIRSGERGRSRYEETTLISNSLKALAKDLGIPVMALAQLNRDSEHDGRLPKMSDLRDSGAIEQDADAVVLLHREEQQPNQEPTVSVIVAKQRNGRTGKIKLVFRPEFTRFESMGFLMPSQKRPGAIQTSCKRETA